MHSASHCKVCLDAPAEERRPAQAQTQLVRIAQIEVGQNVQILQIKVGLIKPVEDDQSVRAGSVQLFGDIGKRGERRTEFDGDGNFDVLLDGPHEIQIHRFDLYARLIGIGGKIVEV